jgi:DNA-binding transcriptional ArsR family regulator
MDRFLLLAQALSDETRVRALLALRERELCLCHLVELFGLAPSTLSRHMSLLRQAGLVTSRREGRWVHYRLARSSDGSLRMAWDWAEKTLRNDPRVKADRKALPACCAA